MATTTLRNAANTPALANVKRAMNAKIYRETLRFWNEGGEAAAREYVGRFFNDEARERCLASLFGSQS